MALDRLTIESMKKTADFKHLLMVAAVGFKKR